MTEILFNPDGIPDSLKKLNQWNASLDTKVPVDAKRTGNKSRATLANPAKPKVWYSFDEASNYTREYAGAKKEYYDTKLKRYVESEVNTKALAFAMSEENNKVIIDVDHAIDANRNLSKEAQELVDMFESYTEISQSGTGLHIIVEGTFPEVWGKSDGRPVEVYPCRHYVALTGNIYKYYDKIVENQEALDALFDKYKNIQAIPMSKSVSNKSNHPVQKPTSISGHSYRSDEDIISRILRGSSFRKKEKSEKVLAIWNGQYERDHSTADLSLCNALCYLCNGDKEQIDRLFRKSKLMRTKWDDIHTNNVNGKKTYGQMTIDKACEGFIPKCIVKPERVSYDDASNLNDGCFYPETFDDIGQAKALAKVYKHQLLYTTNAGFFVYNGTRWECSESKAMGVLTMFLDKQHLLSKQKLEACQKQCEMLGCSGRQASGNVQQKEAMEQLNKAEKFYKMVCSYRKYHNMEAMLKLVKHLVEIPIEKLDSNSNLINTPDYTYDLATGERHEHNAVDLITKCTAVTPIWDNQSQNSIWRKALQTFFGADVELMEFFQLTMGTAIFGSVKHEELIIIYGPGGNGKSCSTSALQKVMGTYGGNLSSEIFIKGCRHNFKAEYAELKGKRLVLASELPSDSELNDSTLKKLCSTDEIVAEKKFYDPFSFIPTHSLIVSTNSLPSITQRDDGTWRRIMIIPFFTKITEEQKIVNYADYLFENAGGAIMAWLIDGARRAKEHDFKFLVPTVIKNLIADYRSANDWLTEFIRANCEISEHYTQKAQALFDAYKTYSQAVSEVPKGKNTFFQELKSAGYSKERTKEGNIYHGLKLKVS